MIEKYWYHLYPNLRKFGVFPIRLYQPGACRRGVTCVGRRTRSDLFMGKTAGVRTAAVGSNPTTGLIKNTTGYAPSHGWLR